MFVDNICAELLQLWESGDIENPNGNICTIDTTYLAKNYYLDDNSESIMSDGDDRDDDEVDEVEIDKFRYSSDSKNRYRQAKVNVIQFLSLFYDPKQLNILLFTEGADDKNLKGVELNLENQPIETIEENVKSEF